MNVYYLACIQMPDNRTWYLVQHSVGFLRTSDRPMAHRFQSSHDALHAAADWVERYGVSNGLQDGAVIGSERVVVRRDPLDVLEDFKDAVEAALDAEYHDDIDFDRLEALCNEANDLINAKDG